MGRTKFTSLGVLLAALILGGAVLGVGKAYAAWDDVAISGAADLVYDGEPKAIGVMEGGIDRVADGSAKIGFSNVSTGPFEDAASSVELLTNAGTVYYEIAGLDGTEDDGDGENYSMTTPKTGAFTIAKLDLSNATVTVEAGITYGNAVKTPVPSIAADGQKYAGLAEADTVLSYVNNKNAHTGAVDAANPPTVTVAASPASVNYKGSVSKTFAIAKAPGSDLSTYVALSDALQDWIDGDKFVNVNSGGALNQHAPPAASGALLGKSGATGFGTAVYSFEKKSGDGEFVSIAAADVKDSGDYKLKIDVAEGSNILAGVIEKTFSVKYKSFTGSPLLAIQRSVQFDGANVYSTAWPSIVAPGVFGSLDSIYNIRAKFIPSGSALDWSGDDAEDLNKKSVTNKKGTGSAAGTGSIEFTIDGAGVAHGVGTVRLTFDAKGKSNDNPKQIWRMEDETMDVQIAERPLADSLIMLTEYPIVYTGRNITDGELNKKFIVIQNGQLIMGTDYEIVEYGSGAGKTALNRKDAGVNQGWIVIKGKAGGNYAGTAMKAFTIERAPITVDVEVVNGPKVYDGKPDIDTNSLMPETSAANTKAYVKATFNGYLPVDTAARFGNGVDYEIRSAKYSDSTAGSICSLMARIALKGSTFSRNYKFAGASADSVVVKAYGLEIKKLNIDSTDVVYTIPKDHYYNGTQRGIAAPSLKAPLALNGGTITALYRYPAGTVKPDFDTAIAALAAPKDTTYIPKKAGDYGVWLKVAGSPNMRDTLVELGTYTVKAPAPAEISFPTAAEDLNISVRQGRSVSLKVSAKSPNGGVLTYKWHTVESVGGNPDSAKAMNVSGLNTTDSVLTVTVSSAVGSTLRYRASVTNTAPAGVQDPRAVTAWTETFVVTVEASPISIVGAKVIVDSSKVWYYTGFPVTPSGSDVTVWLPGAVAGADTTWDIAVDPDEYTLSYVANTNVGTATIRATAILSGKYQGTASTTFAIAQKPFSTVDVAYTAERTYNGDTLGAQVRANPPMTGMGAISVRYGASTDVPVNAGDYDVYVSVAGGANVSSSNGFQYLGAYTINKMTPAAGSLSYTNPDSINHAEGDTTVEYGIGEVKFKAGDYAGTLEVFYDGDSEVPTMAGSYTVTVEIGGDDNIEAGFVTLGVYTIKPKGDDEVVVAVAEADREIPGKAVAEEAAVAPVSRVAKTLFTAGPSPVSKNSGKITFFSAKSIKGGSLYVFDAAGNAVTKVPAKSAFGNEIASWNLRDRKGAAVAEGSYVVKGALVGKDGTREKVSFVFSVVK